MAPAPGGARRMHSHGRGIGHSSMMAVLVQALSSKSLWVKRGGNFGPSGLSDVSEQLLGDTQTSPSCRLESFPAMLQVKPLPG